VSNQNLAPGTKANAVIAHPGTSNYGRSGRCCGV
jgi:hypothetical protein